jgi:hypothetical protein
LPIAVADGLGLGTSLRLSTIVSGPPRVEFGFELRACSCARGDERLSGRQQGESDQDKDSSKGGSAGKDAPREKGVRKQRASELGRALRSIYDDTLRESVPDDFMDLLGKLR